MSIHLKQDARLAPPLAGQSHKAAWQRPPESKKVGYAVARLAGRLVVWLATKFEKYRKMNIAFVCKFGTICLNLISS